MRLHLRDDFCNFVFVDLVDHALSFLEAFLADGEVTATLGDSNRVDAFGALGAGDEVLTPFVHVVDDHVVAGDVEKFLFVNYMQVVFYCSVDTEDELGRQGH